MTERYTKKDADRAFERLCSLLHKRVGHYRKAPMSLGADVNAGLEPGSIRVAGGYVTIPGGWALDYAPGYGGYRVEEIIPGSTGVTCPLGDLRMSAKELWQRVYFLQRALEILSTNQPNQPESELHNV